MGIHYDYKSTKSAKLMEKQAKRERKLAERKAKRIAKEGPKKETISTNTLDPNKPLDLNFLTDPNKNKKIMIDKIKARKAREALALRSNLKKRKLFQKKIKKNDTK